jgi:aspartyl-tRNA(Asn)/glutamyl-tRNA(Gln) amidotransferase subunit A
LILDLADLTGLELTEGFRSLRFTPMDALEACLVRIERCNPLFNAVITLDAEGARQSAAESTRRWQEGTVLSGLDGVPITIKDNLLVEGLRATWGSKLYQTFIADHDELPVARVREAGLVIVGKTNVPEFTLQGYTDNLLFGPARNPWSVELTPGGSSGGAAAAVASGMAPLALCTDGGGSIRRPASHCGLIGHKPTVGRVARANGFPAILYDFEVVGPIARTLDDANALMEILAGPDPLDPSSLCWGEWQFRPDPGRRTRIRFIPAFRDAPVEHDIASSVAAAAEALRDLGHELDEGQCPFELEMVAHSFSAISQVGLGWLLRERMDELPNCTDAIRAMAAAGFKFPATEYVDALMCADEMKRHFAWLLRDWDILLTPATAALPWPAQESHPTVIAGEPVGPRGHAVFTAFANIAGLPGLAVPSAPSKEGLPIGFQLIGRRGHDEQLFTVASQYLGRFPWHKQRPRCLPRTLDGQTSCR